MKKQLLSIIVGCLTVFFCIASLSEAALIITDGLIAAYPFENNTNDVSGNSNDASEYGTIIYSSGVCGQAVNLGSGNFLRTPILGDFTGGEFTFSGWVKLSSLPSGSSNSQYSQIYEAYSEGGELHLEITPSGHSVPGALSASGTSPVGTLPINEWVHIASIYDNGTLSIYMNGELITTIETTVDVSSILNNVGLSIGKDDEYNFQYWNGQMDELLFYNRALSSYEIQELYKETDNTVTDADNDGVPDMWDECPDTPADSFVNNDGCSAEQLGLTSDDGFTQADIDAAVEAAIQVCTNDPASCGISTGFTQADIDAAVEAAIQVCTNDPASCGISTGFAQADIDTAVDAAIQSCVDDPASCEIEINGSNRPPFTGELAENIQSYLVLTENSVPFYMSPGSYVQAFGSDSANTINVEKYARVQCKNFVNVNEINIEEESSQFTVYRSGATVYLNSTSGTRVEIAATETPQILRFADGSLELAIITGNVMLGSQLVDEAEQLIDSPVDENDTSESVF